MATVLSVQMQVIIYSVSRAHAYMSSTFIQ